METVVLNRCPFLAPLAVARGAAAARLGFDADVVEERRRALASAPGLAEKIADVYRTTSDREPAADAELALYDAFIDDADKRAMERVQETLAQPGGAPWPALAFRDGRLRTLAERLKARLRPDELDADERQRWQGHIRKCLGEGSARARRSKSTAANWRRSARKRTLLGGAPSTSWPTSPRSAKQERRDERRPVPQRRQAL